MALYPLPKSHDAFLSFNEALATLNNELEREMTAHLELQHPTLREGLLYSTLLGGKRLRPFLVVTIAHQLQVNPLWAIRVAAAVEYIHCFSLVHDDLPAMDNADLRRGKASCHKKFGEATAVLVGSTLQTLAFEILSEEATHPDATIRCRLIHTLAQATGGQGMIAGQMLDLHFAHSTPLLSEIQHLQSLKSGKLIECSCVLPALMANLPLAEIDLWSGIGQRLGLAYQIIDDLLDKTASQELLGKPIRQDEAMGKATFLTVLGQDEAQDWAKNLIEEVLRLLEKTHGVEEPKELIKQLAYYIIERDR